MYFVAVPFILAHLFILIHLLIVSCLFTQITVSPAALYLSNKCNIRHFHQPTLDNPAHT